MASALDNLLTVGGGVLATSLLSPSDQDIISPLKNPAIPQPLQQFQPFGTSTPGFTGIFQDGNFNLTRNPLFNQALSGLSGGFQQQADFLRSDILPQVEPGIGGLTTSRLAQIEDSRRRAIGNLRDNLARRRVLGSSFATDAIARAEVEFARESERVAAESFLQELDLKTQIAERAFQLEQQKFQTNIEQLNFEGELGARIAESATRAEAANNAALSELLAGLAQAEANVLSASAQGTGDFIGDILTSLLGSGGATGVASGLGGLLGGTGTAAGTAAGTVGSALGGALGTAGTAALGSAIGSNLGGAAGTFGTLGGLTSSAPTGALLGPGGGAFGQGAAAQAAGASGGSGAGFLAGAAAPLAFGLGGGLILDTLLRDQDAQQTLEGMIQNFQTKIAPQLEAAPIAGPPKEQTGTDFQFVGHQINSNLGTMFINNRMIKTLNQFPDMNLPGLILDAQGNVVGGAVLRGQDPGAAIPISVAEATRMMIRDPALDTKMSQWHFTQAEIDRVYSNFGKTKQQAEFNRIKRQKQKEQQRAAGGG